MADVVANDNLTPAGRTVDGVRRIDLRAENGRWRPEGGSGRSIEIQAFGEAGGQLSAPAPLIRVREGTLIEVDVSNLLPETLRIYGLCERGSAPCPSLSVPPNESRQVRFRSGPAGTYHYWATTTGMPQQFRAVDDTQLSGAFIVDPPDGAIPVDRVLVITEWTSLSRAQLQDVASQPDPGARFLKIKPDVFFSINGRIWPHTERLRYRLHELVRWRVINLSTQVHPMHLHGFYFGVEAVGDGLVDSPFREDEKPRVVTRLMAPGSTLTMTWKPERSGNWLFHCHIMTHVSPVLHVDGSLKTDGSHGHDHQSGFGMTGMVIGVVVEGSDEHWIEGSTISPRRLTLSMEQDPDRFGEAPALGFALGDQGSGARSAKLPVPGPTLVLTRGEPVEITLVNRLQESTAIHWHGMELESYYDGVHGWGGSGGRVTPMIEPGDSFVVRFTPPRSGTFIYHTHLHDRRQLTSGLYGALLVVEPDERYDEATDHVLVIGRGGPQQDAPVVINNDRELQLLWKAGTRHRVRLINITPDDVVSVALQKGDAPVAWRPLTKDGAPVAEERRSSQAARQVIGVGETYDFEFETPPGRDGLWLELRSPAGKWLAQARVIVR